MSIKPEDLIGAWHLVDTWVDDADGNRTRHQGPDPKGIIMYTADGHMSAITRWRERPFPESGATDADKARMFDTYLSYAGRWSLKGDTVTHHIEHALNDSWTGLDRPRNIEARDGKMYFTGPAGDGGNATIVWQRERTD